MTARRRVAVFVLALGLAWVGVREWGALPSLEGRGVSAALTDTGGTRLGRMAAPLIAAHPGVSGVHPLRDAKDAFAARIRLAEAAERSLDVQYYIWHKDLTGTLLFQALRAAADRGVRVRVLLDDNNTAGLDEPLAALDSHPNVEIRLFNPFVIRGPRALGYLTDFFRLNRRMHNKSFTADNQATIVGGRNIGDEYFGASDGVLFADLDVIAVGPVVSEVSGSFDRYWASASSYPVRSLLPAARPGLLEELTASAQQIANSSPAVAYMKAVRESAFIRDLAAGTLEIEWAPTRMVSDDPAKGLGRGATDELVAEKLKRDLGEPATDVKLVSPYFVPGAAGTSWLADMAERGVAVHVLTNSLEATDVAYVHAGYAKWRKRLLAAGVALYELRLGNSDRGPAGTGGSGSGGGSRGSGSGSQSAGSSQSSLHAKTFSVDHARVFIGSFNFDPRSKKLNTEMGFVIESPRLAGEMDRIFLERIPEAAYEVRASRNGRLSWIERHGGETSRRDTEPGTTKWKRAWIRFLSTLPIEWLL
ncbi:MAG: phospholipase D family protein [Acidobacteriota bacterium]